MSHDSLGQEVVYNDATETLTHLAGGGSHHGGGGSGGGGTAPPPNLVGSSSGLQFDLIWDSSVANAPAAFQTDVINTATYLASLFTTPEVINVHVGWGEINGQGLSGGALGESETPGYLVGYSTVANFLGNELHVALNEPTTAQFYLSSAQAKAAGLIDAHSTATDGYVGFGTLGNGASWNYGTSPIGSTQYDLQGVVFHELTEVMGRIAMDGTRFNGHPTYTALDLFDYKSPGMLELSTAGGYYSDNGGNDHLGNFNGSAHSGDVADWLSYDSITEAGTTGLATGDQDAFNAFSWNGVAADLSTSDVDLMHSIGFSGSDLLTT